MRCIYSVFGRETTEDTVIYGVCIRFWPTLCMLDPQIVHVLGYVHAIQCVHATFLVRACHFIQVWMRMHTLRVVVELLRLPVLNSELLSVCVTHHRRLSLIPEETEAMHLVRGHGVGALASLITQHN
jgi:hypothetical protein